jgi:hypothetical protein
VIKRRRLVALFDILGFGTKLKNESLALIRRQLRQFIRAIRSQALTNSTTNIEPEHDDNLESARFVFDSVLLVSHPTEDSRHVHNFIFACISLLEFGFKHRFPFRGSIVLSDVFVDEETGLIIGDQFPELRDAEQMQEWSGCFIHPNASDLAFASVIGNVDPAEKKRSPVASDAFHWLEVPVKDAFAKWRPLNAWCLNWAYLLDERAVAQGLRYLGKDVSKHTNTEQYLRRIRSLPNDLTVLEGAVPKGTLIKTIKSRHGFRAGFVDGRGNSVGLQKSKLHFSVVAPNSEVVEERDVHFPSNQQTNEPN